MSKKIMSYFFHYILTHVAPIMYIRCITRSEICKIKLIIWIKTKNSTKLEPKYFFKHSLYVKTFPVLQCKTQQKIKQIYSRKYKNISTYVYIYLLVWKILVLLVWFRNQNDLIRSRRVVLTLYDMSK